MNTKIISTGLILSSLILMAPKADAYYIGASVGSSKTKVSMEDKINMQSKTAFTVSTGMEIPLPLIPIRAEVEYLQLKSDKDGADMKTYGVGANAYVGLPLLPIIKPYVGMGLGYLKQDQSYIVEQLSNLILP